MTNRLKAFPVVSCAYGAPMGRMSANLQLSYDTDAPDSIACIGPAYEYDKGGVYWGYSSTEGGIWAVWRRGKMHEGVAYVRGKTRDMAIYNALSHDA